MEILGTQRLTAFKFILAVACLAACIARSQTIYGIPEPGLILYGQVRNTTTGMLQTYGTLKWIIQPPSGSAITLYVPLTNINDQFSYVLRVPFESVPAVTPPLFAPSGTALVLSNSQVTYTRTPAVSPTTVTYTAGTIVSPALGTFSFGAADRGRSERVDVQAAVPVVDTNGNGMDDNWEMAYFGNLSRTGTGDFDHDGMSDFAEYKAGTNPTDAESRFAFLSVGPDPLGGMAVRWSSVTLHQYTVQRSADLLAGFTNLQTNLDATPGTNYFRDAAATNRGPYFYRLRVQ
jgi:hypothetical protein